MDQLQDLANFACEADNTICLHMCRMSLVIGSLGDGNAKTITAYMVCLMVTVLVFCIYLEQL